ncbi:hypothetical protein K474DRAFT_1670280 [Panus rudis PR-1116 ss-1]|nr:hypothetical protein K474DRAFT_1670280 [Panus rudis PR-1116 ss-1]
MNDSVHLSSLVNSFTMQSPSQYQPEPWQDYDRPYGGVTDPPDPQGPTYLEVNGSRHRERPRGGRNRGLQYSPQALDNLNPNTFPKLNDLIPPSNITTPHLNTTRWDIDPRSGSTRSEARSQYQLSPVTPQLGPQQAGITEISTMTQYPSRVEVPIQLALPSHILVIPPSIACWPSVQYNGIQVPLLPTYHVPPTPVAMYAIVPVCPHHTAHLPVQWHRTSSNRGRRIRRSLSGLFGNRSTR